MFDYLFGVIILGFIILQSITFALWYEEHKTIIAILTHHIIELKKHIQSQNKTLN